MLDEETIKRGQHMGAAWSAASMALDVSFKTAAIEFLPYATRLLQWTSEMARGLSGIVDQMNRVEDRGTENLRHQAQQLGWEHERLVREQWRLGGRATPGLSSADFAGVDPTSPRRRHRGDGVHAGAQHANLLARSADQGDQR